MEEPVRALGFTKIYRSPCRMSGNKAKALRTAATDVEKHIQLVQPRRTALTAPLEERQKIRQKIKVRATGRKAVAMEQLRVPKKRESRLIPAEGGGMGMGMQMD